MTRDEMNDVTDPRWERALEAIRREFSRAPEEYIAQRHLRAMRAASGSQAGERVDRPGRLLVPRFTPAWITAGVAALIGFTGGLAAADALPDPAQHLVARTVSNIGIDLPDPRGNDDDSDDNDNDNDDGDAKPDNHGKTVSSVAHDPTLEGCEHGQAVSDVASSKNQANPDAPGQSEDRDPCAKDEDESGDDDDSGDADADDDSDDADDDSDDATPGSSPGNSGNHGSNGQGRGQSSGDDDSDESDDDEDGDDDEQDGSQSGKGKQGNQGNQGQGGGKND